MYVFVGCRRSQCVAASLNTCSYEADDGETVTEQSPLTSTTRAQKLLDAENACRSNGGAAWAGLYTLERGAHSFWLNSGKDVSGRADGIINLLHYDDAAGACMAAVKTKAGDGAIFLVSDGNPLTRKEICEFSMKNKMYAGKTMPGFQGGETDKKGKIYDGTWTNKELNWKPTHHSFAEFMTQDSSYSRLKVRQSYEARQNQHIIASYVLSKHDCSNLLSNICVCLSVHWKWNPRVRPYSVSD